MMPTSYIHSPVESTSKTSTMNRKCPRIKASMGTIKLVTLIACSICLFACLFPAQPVECGRLQDFIQNLVGGRDSSSSSSNSNSNSNTNSNSNSNDSNDSDTAATGESSSNDQQMTPMMSAMNPFMRYPSFYDSFSPASYGGYPGMSFSNPMGAMSGLSPLTMSGSSLGNSFASPSFGPASFGSFGSPTGGNPMSAFGGAGSGLGAASNLNNIYASSPSLMGGYTPYYGRRR